MRLLTRVVLPLVVLVVLPRLVALVVVRTSLMVLLSGLRLRSRGCSGSRLCDKGLRLGVEVVLVVLGRTGLTLRSRGSATTLRRGNCGLRLGVELVLPTRGCTGSCVRLVVTVVVVIVVPVVPPALIMFLRMRRIWARMRRRSS